MRLPMKQRENPNERTRNWVESNGGERERSMNGEEIWGFWGFRFSGNGARGEYNKLFF